MMTRNTPPADFPRRGVRNLMAVRHWLEMQQRSTARLGLAAFKRGYFVGLYGRAIWFCPLTGGVLRESWRHGWRVGAEYRKTVQDREQALRMFRRA